MNEAFVCFMRLFNVCPLKLFSYSLYFNANAFIGLQIKYRAGTNSHH